MRIDYICSECKKMTKMPINQYDDCATSASLGNSSAHTPDMWCSCEEPVEQIIKGVK